MIKNIIFDFGDIFVDLDKTATIREMQKLGMQTVSEEMTHHYHLYEKGMISTDDFVGYFQGLFPWISEQELIQAWNAVILFFPEHRLEWIKKLSAANQYRLFLLSNTNALHISKVKEHMTNERYNDFKDCFEQFYLSHEIHLRKPDTEVYEFVLDENNLQAHETLFIDDTTENTEAASRSGIKTWNLVPGKDEVTRLFDQKHAFD